LNELMPGALYLPDVGLTGSDERAASKAVREYDADCRLGQRKDTGEWIVYMTNPATGEPFPVLGLGTRLPSPDEILRRMYQTDVRRHGDKIFRDIMRRQDAAHAAQKQKADDASEAVADALVSGYRKQGHNPFPRIFVPGGKS
jgi:hypothetical protein